MTLNAGDYLLKNGGKAWKYLLIPHDEVKENFQLGDIIIDWQSLYSVKLIQLNNHGIDFEWMHLTLAKFSSSMPIFN